MPVVITEDAILGRGRVRGKRYVTSALRPMGLNRLCLGV